MKVHGNLPCWSKMIISNKKSCDHETSYTNDSIRYNSTKEFEPTKKVSVSDNDFKLHSKKQIIQKCYLSVIYL